MSTAARPLRGLPLALQKKGCTLLHPQCWLWGQDVRREQGNLLLEYGFKRVRPPKSVSGCSQYSLALDAEMQLRQCLFGWEDPTLTTAKLRHDWSDLLQQVTDLQSAGQPSCG